MNRSGPVAAALIALLAVVPSAVRAQAAAQLVAVTATPVPLIAEHPGERRVGDLTYVGGLQLTASADPAFGGLSDIDVLPNGRFISQSDAGDLLTGRIVLDRRGRLAGLADTGWAKLTDEQGQPYGPVKDLADSEDITYLPGGGFAVSFEQFPRVEVYKGVGPARRIGVPAEAKDFPANYGLEGLAAWTDARGRPRLVEGSEDGRAWSCDMDGADCRKILDNADDPETDFSLTGLDALPDGRGMVAVFRAFDLLQGSRCLIAWFQPDAPRKITVLARLAAPYTVDNMEGIAAVKNRDGSIRLYLVSDDNLSKTQRTLLMAFDWTIPKAPRRARR